MQKLPHEHDATLPIPEESLPSKAHQVSSETIPVVEETLEIHKRVVQGGGVRVRAVTDLVEEIARIQLEHDRVEVTRVPVDRVVDAAPEIRTEGDVTIVPVLEEVMVTTKRLLLKEELRIRRHPTTETVEAPVTLRKQRAVVERFGPNGELQTPEETT
jgi:uncharacterized protein (TIGR02271 family)